MKQCVGTVTLDAVKGKMNITCEEVSGPFCPAGTAKVVGCGTFLGPKTRAEEGPPALATPSRKPQVSSTGSVSFRALVR